MNMLNKAIRLVGQMTKKGPGVDPGAVIRSALEAAGLMGGATRAPTAPGEGLVCLAAPGLTNRLDTILPALRRPAQPSGGPASSGTDGDRFAWQSITGPWGVRRFKLFTPNEPPRALIVMLHGCSQNPDDFAAGTGMNALAEANGLLVAYPEQPRSANPSGCWNWFNTADQQRGHGEPALIAAITRAVAAAHDLPPGRCFVAGLSAGGAMAAIMAETDPDLYAAAGIHSGLPYRAATDMASAFAAMQGNGSKGAEGMPPATAIPMIVFHGDADRTVHPGNAERIVGRLAAGLPGLSRDTQAGVSPGGQAYRRTTGRDGEGAVRFEAWRLTGAGHAWAGGKPAGSYTDPLGVDASREMVRFFLERIDLPLREAGRVSADASR